MGQPVSANDTDSYRFPLSENEAAAVCVHAELAAAMIRALFARQEHYVSIGKALHDQDGTVAPKSDQASVWNAVAGQIKASGETVARLAADARAQLPERLSNLKEPIYEADTTLQVPPAQKRALTFAVMAHMMTLAMRDTAEQIQRLTQAMSKVSTPEVLVLGAELDQLAAKMRPQGMPPVPTRPSSSPRSRTTDRRPGRVSVSRRRWRRWPIGTRLRRIRPPPLCT